MRVRSVLRRGLPGALPGVLLGSLFVALASARGPARGGAAQADDGRGRESLEEILAEIRRRRAETRERLVVQVERVAADLERIGGQPEALRDPAAALRAVEDLGSEAAPLFVPYLEPGEKPSQRDLYRAETVARGLEQVPSDALVAPLLRLAREGTPPARRLAVRLLGRGSKTPEVTAFLVELCGTAQGELEVEAASAVARCDTAEARAALRSKLLDASPEVARSILSVWTGERVAEGAESVLALARTSQRAAAVLPAILAYWRALPGVVGDGVRVALLDLATDASVRSESRVRALDALVDLELFLGGDVRDRLGPLGDSFDVPLREAALVCLALAGDRNARRSLLRGMDEEVEGNEDYPPAYEKRGDLLFRLRDYGDAARDYKKAIELLARGRRSFGPEIRIKLARAYARGDRLRNAYETLQEAGLRPEELAALAQDPDFADLRAHSRYGRVFE